ncbi:cysteine-rich receptor-like protein kinase 3 isoform X2 [Telopea speciosissima]|uniref:cysteine-rich receptor-like protein kinase 3 isoform X2 n=1 Tax=Telopea speciosissima TaxID=54955 RepID=UPI001CC44FE6|nr:cysteine-rich receptor-like protein kinase 3 isoform X2 [Telopea speciosissima]
MSSPCSLIICVFFLFFSLFTSLSVSDPRATMAGLICSNNTASPSQRQSFVDNFVAAMDAVTPQVTSRRYARVVSGSGNTTVYAFGQCMNDLSQTDCDLCFAQCKTQIPKCVPFQKATRGGRDFFDGCYLRYDEYDFFSEALSPEDRTVCGNQSFAGNRIAFRANTIVLMKNLSAQAPKNGGFFVGYVDRGNSTVYGLAQCWEYLNASACSSCLRNGVSRIGSCLPNDEGRVLNAGCYMRYSTQKFYNNSTSVAAGGGGHHLAIILAVTPSVLVALMVVVTAIFFGKRELARRRRERKQLGALVSTVNKSELNFKYETLERATNYFDNSNKLGQGGSGSVYKGIFPDGRVVAIKRLFFNTRQWVDHFFNEVNLISGLHHKNLVKLLGCSITGPESLLVYEYVPNRSLHDYLFDRNNARQLSWELRYNIILGTAEGLAYLHEESNLRIIHRDIKLSNVLLDENFTAKIADFGLARLFPEDKTHVSTAVAGTLGYMAPEYVVCGKLTEKADVYSFGVLVIEVACGKRNNSFLQDSLSILQMVWNLYGSGRLSEAVDPQLEGGLHEEEACQVLQIGLLCIQASAELRPSMSMVVKMLTDKHDIPRPTQPPFLNSRNMMSSIPPPGSYNSQPESCGRSSGNNETESLIEPR